MGATPSKVYTVYILQSLKHPNRFYIHSTSHPFSLQQYIPSSNNKHKSKHWKLLLIVYGFTGRPSMTMFAQRWAHPQYTSKINDNDKQQFKLQTIENRIALLYKLLASEHYSGRALHVQYIDNATYQQYHENASKLQALPSHTSVRCSPLDSLLVSDHLTTEQQQQLRSSL